MAAFTEDNSETPKGNRRPDQLDVALLEAPKPRIIISGEAFSVAAYRPGLERFRDILRQSANHIRVIAYIRPPQSLIASDFQQCARAGVAVKFGRNAEYLQRMRMLDDVFGPQNVQFHVFSRDTLIHGDVVQDFATRIGVEVENDAVWQANQSVSLECVAVSRCATLFGQVGVGNDMNPVLNYFASDHLQALGNKKFRIAPDVLNKLVEPHLDEMELVQQRIGGRFPEPPQTGNGIRTDQDLIDIAIGLEDRVVDLLAGLAGFSETAPEIIQSGIRNAKSRQQPELRIATLVDTIKRVRLSKETVERAA